jgi:HAD superfamily hydrolase (TIGR01509 family)
MPETKAVLFDFGGTLFSYETTIPVRRERAVKLAQLIGHSEVDAVHVALHEGTRAAFNRVMRHPFYMHVDVMMEGVDNALGTLGAELTQTQLDGFRDRTFLRGVSHAAPRPGMRTTLQAIRVRGIHLGGVSNADIGQFDAMIEMLDVRDIFHSLLCSEEAQSCKPDPGIFHQALERAGCAPEEAVFVGDTPIADIEGAEAVGMRAVLIEETTDIAIDRGDPSIAKITIKELPELLDLI